MTKVVLSGYRYWCGIELVLTKKCKQVYTVQVAQNLHMCLNSMCNLKILRNLILRPHRTERVGKNTGILYWWTSNKNLYLARVVRHYQNDIGPGRKFIIRSRSTCIKKRFKLQLVTASALININFSLQPKLKNLICGVDF